MARLKRKFFPDNTQPDGSHIHLEEMWDGAYVLQAVKIAPPLDAQTWARLTAAAVDYAHKNLIGKLMCRIAVPEEAPPFSVSLKAVGFRHSGSRIEFTRLVSELPDDKDTPITWKTADEAGFDANAIAALLVQVAQGDPTYDPKEDPHAAISDWLNDTTLTSGLSCISIGFSGGRPMALSVAQVNPKTGWSRISYMGLLPEFRGKGLGVWLHRRGFTSMKQQGGVNYHGGTSVDNHSMRRLFALHGCKQVGSMDEWELPLLGPTISRPPKSPRP